MQQQTDSLLGPFRVIDLTEGGINLCGKVLADMGADVIKIEPPGGSAARNTGPFYNDIVDPEKSLFWFAYNTSKRGITLDIEKDDGREIFRSLVKGADVIVESFLPGYMEKLGLAYSDLSQIKSDIVMTSITPFGQTGPYSGYKGAEIVGWAMGGMMGLCGDNDRPPVQVSHPHAYYHAGVQGAVGSLVALYHREMSGEGQHVDVSMQQAVVLTLMNAIEMGDLMGMSPPRPSPEGVSTLPRPEPHGPLTASMRWECKDGHITWAHLLAGGAQAGMVFSTNQLVGWMEENGMAGDLPGYDWSQFDTSTVPQEEVDHQREIFKKFFLSKTKREILDNAVKRGMLIAPYQTTKDISECPHLAGREYYTDVQHPELGDTITYPGAWAKISDVPWRISRRAPLVGEHNEEIYEKELGITRENLILLKNRAII